MTVENEQSTNKLSPCIYYDFPITHGHINVIITLRAILQLLLFNKLSVMTEFHAAHDRSKYLMNTPIALTEFQWHYYSNAIMMWYDRDKEWLSVFVRALYDQKMTWDQSFGMGDIKNDAFHYKYIFLWLPVLMLKTGNRFINVTVIHDSILKLLVFCINPRLYIG